MSSVGRDHHDLDVAGNCEGACGESASGASRRAFLLMGLGVLLTGCGAPPQKTAARMPGPIWRPRDPYTPAPLPPPRPMEPPVAAVPAGPSWIIPRTTWTSVRPTFTMMDRMLPIHSITVHHDGMRPFLEGDERGSVNRLEAIRRSHREHRQWGDIGYHYAVDRAGRVWECRPLSHQGAHVKDHNEGNIGVLALGNFDQQAPTPAQLDGLMRHVSWLMHHHRVPVSRLRTHREWETARTACPGTSLQRFMDDARRSGRFA
jgi:hypothetical protein